MKKTVIQIINEPKIERDKIHRAARIIREGGTVVFPTETVYGLGANALSPIAVEKIFTAKGRPSDNPLIVHISDKKDIESLIQDDSQKARKLMEAFWPGPLTLILKKSLQVPQRVTGGLSTVAIRMPQHPVALALIEDAGIPIAAPSANLSGKPSPTNAKRVIEDLQGKVDMIIDGGPCKIGLESTVLDLTGENPVILRPGGVTREMIEGVVGKVEEDPALKKGLDEGVHPKAPGMKYKHYAPSVPVKVYVGNMNQVSDAIQKEADDILEKGSRVGILGTEENAKKYTASVIRSLGSRNRPEEIAANLFEGLRAIDEKKVDYILAEGISEENIGSAVMNRLRKAAGYNIVYV